MEFGDTQAYKVSKEAQKMQSEVRAMVLSRLLRARGALFLSSTRQQRRYMLSSLLHPAGGRVLNFSYSICSFFPRTLAKLSGGFLVLDCTQTKHLSLVFCFLPRKSNTKPMTVHASPPLRYQPLLS